jgi:hypothetical protein
MTLNYNTTLLQALSVTIDPDEWFAMFWPNGVSISEKVIDDATGRIHMVFGGIAGKNGLHVPPNGYGSLARIIFNATYWRSPPSGFTLTPTVILGFPHPERSSPPWNGSSDPPSLPHEVVNGICFLKSADVNYDGVVDILDVVTLTVIYGCREEDPKWNQAVDLVPPYGVIDILDLVIITSHYGQRYN